MVFSQVKLQLNKVLILYLPKTGIEPISKSYKEFILPIKLFRPLPWERIELTYLYLQNSALTTKLPRLNFIAGCLYFLIKYNIFAQYNKTYFVSNIYYS